MGVMCDYSIAAQRMGHRGRKTASRHVVWNTADEQLFSLPVRNVGAISYTWPGARKGDAFEGTQIGTPGSSDLAC